MEGFNASDVQEMLTQFETPFNDVTSSNKTNGSYPSQSNERFSYMPELESPFSQTFEPIGVSNSLSNQETRLYTELLGELESENFTESLYELATELEDSWNLKVSNEYAMGEAYLGFVKRDSETYFQPILRETNHLIDRTNEYFTGNNLSDHNEANMERFFNEILSEYRDFSPAQENFFGSIMKKVKSVVGKGIEFAKKGIAAVGKLIPIGPILNKIKGLVKPLLDKVLQFAINKLPVSLRPHAHTLANKLFGKISGVVNQIAPNIERQEETLSSGNINYIQTEFDHYVAEAFLSGEQSFQSEQFLQEYEMSFEAMDREFSYEMGGYNPSSLDVARNQFIKELSELQAGESPQPAIERFLPAAIMALQPIIKIAIQIIGRPKIINFLGGLLAKLVGKFIPAEFATPLSNSIVDIGLGALGFETAQGSNNLAFEAIASTLESTIANMNFADENLLNDQNELSANLMEAFEEAVSNHFPPQYLREAVKNSSDAGLWILKSRQVEKKLYKKYTTILNITIDPKQAKEVFGFNGIPLYNILKDQYGIDPNKPVQAKVHLFEAIHGTKLSYISRNEKVNGLMNNPLSYKLIQPLTKLAGNILFKSSTLGKDFCKCSKWYKTFVGQRFYYLEIQGSRIVIPTNPVKPNNPVTPSYPVNPIRPIHPIDPIVPKPPIQSQASDIQAILNFIKSEVRINYFFSESDAISVGSKLEKNDYLGAAISIRYSVRNVLHGVLLRNVTTKVKIIHEAMPELYLENFEPNGEEFAPLAAIGSLAPGVGKDLLIKLVEKLVDKFTDYAIKALENYFKARATEFIQAQKNTLDGVTVKIIWFGIPGMSTISTLINAVKGNLSIGNITDMVLPTLPTPDVQVSAGKKFD